MPNHTIVEHRDSLETAVLLAMSATDIAAEHFKVRTEQRRRGATLYALDMDAFCSKRPVFPSRMLTVDAHGNERLYTASMDNIVVNPRAAIEAGLETCILCDDGSLKWFFVRPRATAPKGLVALTNLRHSWFELHFRHIYTDMCDVYTRMPFPMTENNRVCAMKAMGWSFNAKDAQQDRAGIETNLTLALSIFEDAMRRDAYLATVEEHTKLSFPIGEAEYLAFLRLRDGYRNTPTGRRNPILHWCAEHFRSRGDQFIPVKGHLRGAEEFVVGPMKLTIEPTPGYEPFK